MLTASAARCAAVAGSLPHRPKLQDRELLQPHPETPLPEDDRPTRVEPDREGDDEDERRRNDQADRRADKIDGALDQARGRAQDGRRKPEQGHTFERMDVDLRANRLEEPWHDVDLHLDISQRANQRDRLVGRVLGEGDDDPLDAQRPHDLPEGRRVCRAG